ncbi:hypothetical protein ACTFJW_17875 [Clostridium cagae]|uniref:hypothetical protein n=1 Tax=Clostridium cagae TaxID=2080751 RepID=UPI003F76EE8C
MIKVKELKKILEQSNDNDILYLKFAGTEAEIERGDTFCNMNIQDVEVEKNKIIIWF